MDIVTTLYNVSDEKIFFILLAFSLILGIGKRLFMLKKCYNYIIAAFLFFYPFGFLFGSLNVDKINSKRWMIIPISCALSFIIELSQYVFKLGYAEIDDVIHNTLGCAIGLLFCILLEKAFSYKPSK